MSFPNSTRYCILSGGPGMGKTAIINMLAAQGYTCFPESGRAIIRQQLDTGGPALPWHDREAFARLMFRQAIADYHAAAAGKGLVFFDRALPDVIGYLELCRLPVPPGMEAAMDQYRYHRLVAITPPWQEIYTNDTERKQNFDEAIATYHMMQQIYSRYGYDVVVVPQKDVAYRAAFVKRCMAM